MENEEITHNFSFFCRRQISFYGCHMLWAQVALPASPWSSNSWSSPAPIVLWHPGFYACYCKSLLSWMHETHWGGLLLFSRGVYGSSNFSYLCLVLFSACWHLHECSGHRPLHDLLHKLNIQNLHSPNLKRGVLRIDFANWFIVILLIDSLWFLYTHIS